MRIGLVDPNGCIPHCFVQTVFKVAMWGHCLICEGSITIFAFCFMTYLM